MFYSWALKFNDFGLNQNSHFSFNSHVKGNSSYSLHTCLCVIRYLTNNDLHLCFQGAPIYNCLFLFSFQFFLLFWSFYFLKKILYFQFHDNYSTFGFENNISNDLSFIWEFGSKSIQNKTVQKCHLKSLLYQHIDKPLNIKSGTKEISMYS